LIGQRASLGSTTIHLALSHFTFLSSLRLLEAKLHTHIHIHECYLRKVVDNLPFNV